MKTQQLDYRTVIKKKNDLKCWYENSSNIFFSKVRNYYYSISSDILQRSYISKQPQINGDIFKPLKVIWLQVTGSNKPGTKEGTGLP